MTNTKSTLNQLPGWRLLLCILYACARQPLYPVWSCWCRLHSELGPGSGGSDGQDSGTAACQPLMSCDAVGRRGWGWTGWAVGSMPGELAWDRRVTFCFGKWGQHVTGAKNKLKQKLNLVMFRSEVYYTAKHMIFGMINNVILLVSSFYSVCRIWQQHSI